jgi:hypothetical protein
MGLKAMAPPPGQSAAGSGLSPRLTDTSSAFGACSTSAGRTSIAGCGGLLVQVLNCLEVVKPGAAAGLAHWGCWSWTPRRCASGKTLSRSHLA